MLALLLLYVVPGVMLWVAAWLSGGRPGNDIWSWPARAVSAALKGQPPAPWTWAGATRMPSPVLFYTVLALVAMLLAAVVLVAYTVVQGGLVAWSPSVFRSGRRTAPISRRQVRRLRVGAPRPGRMIIGQRGRLTIASRPGDSLLILGPTDSGKTSAFCVPIIQEWSGPVVAAGVGLNLFGPTAGIRQRLGPVEVYDPAAVSGLGSCTWSPITGCEETDVAVRRAGWMLPDAIRTAIHHAGVGMPSEAVTALLVVSLWAAARRRSSLADMLRWLQDPGLADLHAAVESDQPAGLRAMGWLASLEKLAVPARLACCRALDDLLSPVERSSRSAKPPPFDPGSFLTGATGGEPTLYLVGPQDGSRRTASLRCGLLGAVLDHAFAWAARQPRQTPGRRLLVVIDGTASATPVRELAQYLAVAGELDITFLVTFRDLSDVEQGYGSAGAEVVASAQEVVFLGAQAHERTLQLLGDLAQRMAAGEGRDGRRWRSGRPQSGDHGALPESARLLGQGQGLLISDVLPPIPFWARPWARTASLRELAAANPYNRGVSWVEAVEE